MNLQTVASANRVRQHAFGISDVERILCAGTAEGSLESLLPRTEEAWTARFPRLDCFSGYPEGKRPLRLCIATEQITGPVRNGGIGTTYAALAELLAADGHDVTVLYLRGTEVETETIEHWIADYAAKGVSLVPVPDYAGAAKIDTPADRWLRAPYNMMRYLMDNPMDVVHVSEWRGSGYLSLLAKRQGIAFLDTLFIVKTSSPWMWNRLYGSHAIDRTDDLVKVTAERQSVELADMVIGGSLHLLRWMASQGYAIPQSRTFVQPNVATFDKLAPLMERRSLAQGERMPVAEMVFFGRLEPRKGLFIFCQAIRRLIRKGVALPPKITFMGKPGARMASHPNLSTPDYIRMVTQSWPAQVEILTDFQQYDAIEYLLADNRLAVMPSIIENSSMAIYEAAICKIPCIATDVGGNAELIHEDDRPEVLCKPHPVSLADRLESALTLGGLAPRPSFDNEENLATWRRFHRQLAGPLRDQLLHPADPNAIALDASNGADAAPPVVTAKTTICIYFTGNALELDRTLAGVAAQRLSAHQTLIAVDAENEADIERATSLLAEHRLAGAAVEAFDLDAGAAFNLLAAQATGDQLLFLWEGAFVDPEALQSLGAVAATSGAMVINFLHRTLDSNGVEDRSAGTLRALVIGSASDTFFRSDTREMPLYVSRASFFALDGFSSDYRVLGYDHEFVAKAQLAGVACETALIELGSIQSRSPEWLRGRGYDVAASEFRVIRPKLAAAPLGMRDLLLFARGMQDRGEGDRVIREAERPVLRIEGMLTRMIAGLDLVDAEPKTGQSNRKRSKNQKALLDAVAVEATTLANQLREVRALDGETNPSREEKPKRPARPGVADQGHEGALGAGGGASSGLAAFGILAFPDHY